MDMENGSIILHPKEKGPPPPFPLLPIIEKIVDSKWIMDPLFSALILILGQWKMDPRKIIIMAPPPPLRKIMKWTGNWIHYFAPENNNDGAPPPSADNNEISEMDMENVSIILQPKDNNVPPHFPFFPSSKL